MLPQRWRETTKVTGGRLQYLKRDGEGPELGWVSLQAAGKRLLEELNIHEAWTLRKGCVFWVWWGMFGDGDVYTDEMFDGDVMWGCLGDEIFPWGVYIGVFFVEIGWGVCLDLLWVEWMREDWRGNLIWGGAKWRKWYDMLFIYMHTMCIYMYIYIYIYIYMYIYMWSCSSSLDSWKDILDKEESAFWSSQMFLVLAQKLSNQLSKLVLSHSKMDQTTNRPNTLR